MTLKHSFYDDYSEGASPAILKALARTNEVPQLGYMQDDYSKQAIALIREAVGDENVDVHFVTSGTQANLVVLSWLLRAHEAVIAVRTGHIDLHEAGAIEATGHKIIGVDPVDGKLTADAVEQVVEHHQFEQMVLPKAVYISQSTEVGTIYTKSELEALSVVCKKHDLFLYVDGARLGSALAADTTGLDLPTLTKLVDAFYIGGTKNGALMGEAIVLVHADIRKAFRRHLRQKGALLAKGRGVSVQFMELFTNDLYALNARHANRLAQKLSLGLKNAGIELLVDSPTNQVFPILSKDLIEKLSKQYGFHVWEKVEAHRTAVRFVTSWATKEEAVDELLRDVRQLAL